MPPGDQRGVRLREDVERYERRFEAVAEGIYGAEVSPMPGVGSLFDDLRDRGRVGVVSSAPREWIQTVVDRFDLDPLGTVVSAEGIDGPGKPDPTIYRVAADRLGVADSAAPGAELRSLPDGPCGAD